MKEFGDTLQSSYYRGIVAFKPNIFRLLFLAFAITISDYFKPYNDLYNNLGTFNYVMVAVGVVLVALLIFEASRFGLLVFNKFGGWISLVFLVTIVFSSRLLVVLCETYQSEPINKLSAPMFIFAGFLVGALFGVLKKYDTEDNIKR